MAIYLNEKSFEKLKPLKNGSGAFGKCFFLDKNKNTLIKTFFDEELLKELDKSLDNFLNIENDTFVFPNEKVYINNKFKGYSMKYINAPDLGYCHDINLIHFANCLEKVQKDTFKISQDKILASDIKDTNILYKDKINIIDIDFYEKITEEIYSFLPFSKKGEKIENYCFRINNNELCEAIIDKFKTNQIFNKIVLENSFLRDQISYVLDEHNFINLKNFILDFKKEAEEYTGQSIETEEDLTRTLKSRWYL